MWPIVGPNETPLTYSRRCPISFLSHHRIMRLKLATESRLESSAAGLLYFYTNKAKEKCLEQRKAVN